MVDESKESYANRQRIRLEDRRNRMVDESNETERSLGSQLTLVGTVLLTGNVIFLGNISTVNYLTSSQKMLVLSGLVFVCASLAAGIAYYLETIGFYTNWALALDDSVDVFADRAYKDIDDANEKAMKPQKAQPTIASKRFLFAQLGLLLGATLSYIFVVLALLIDFSLLFKA